MYPQQIYCKTNNICYNEVINIKDDSYFYFNKRKEIK